jgi:hypothetical protein
MGDCKMKCAFEYGPLDMAVMNGIHRPDWVDEKGHCKLEAVGEYEGEQYCLGHLTILQQEAQRLQEFLMDK